MVCRCLSLNTYDPFVQIYERLTMKGTCLLQPIASAVCWIQRAFTNGEIDIDIDLYSIEFSIVKAWFEQHVQYWLTDLGFKMRA